MRTLWGVMIAVVLWSMPPAWGATRLLAEQFALGLRNGKVALIKPLLAPAVRYARLDLSGRSRRSVSTVTPGGKLPFMRRVNEVSVDMERMTDAVIVLTLIDEEPMDSRFVEHAELWITVVDNQVAGISEIALEGSYPGAPAGCPETSIKRNEIATLNGLLGTDKHTVRVFQTARNTDAWAFTEKGSCKPTPGILLEDTEVVAQARDGQIAAYRHVGRLDRTAGGGEEGITLYDKSGGGALVSGGARLYAIDGTGYLFIARQAVRPGHVGDAAMTSQLTQYALQGGSLKPIWNFLFGDESGHWQLAAPAPDGSVQAVARGAACNGESLTLHWTGKGFKASGKNCIRGSWPGEGILGKYETDLVAIALHATKEQRKIEAESGPAATSSGAISGSGPSDASEGLLH